MKNNIIKGEKLRLECATLSRFDIFGADGNK